VGQYVQIQGIVTKMSLVKPKIQTSVHYCEETKKGVVKHYNDKYNLAQLGEKEEADSQNKHIEMNNTFPTKDQNDNPLTAEYGYCVYSDS